MYMTKRQNNNKNTKSSAHCVFWRRITAVLWYVVERAGVPWQMQLNYLLARIKIYLLAKITGNTEQCDKNSKGEDNIRRWRILLLREVVSKGRRKESKGCHETHERERRESLGGAVVRNHFLGAGLNPGLFGEISLVVSLWEIAHVCSHEAHVEGVVERDEVAVRGNPPERKVHSFRRHLLVLAVSCNENLSIWFCNKKDVWSHRQQHNNITKIRLTWQTKLFDLKDNNKSWLDRQSWL